MEETAFSGLHKARRVAFMGNPNVGKSTLFNALTGLHQHTGNWPGKTVASAQGSVTYDDEVITLIDLPGTYSLFPTSAEEKVASEYLFFGGADAVMLVADATCLERGLLLTLQVLEATRVPVVLCVNLLDEARRRGIRLDLAALSNGLSIPVVGVSARSGEGFAALRAALRSAAHARQRREILALCYPDAVERALHCLEPTLSALTARPARALALHLLLDDDLLHTRFPEAQERIADALARARASLSALTGDELRDAVAGVLSRRAAALAAQSVHADQVRAQRFDRRLDRLLTSRGAGIPVMLLLLGLILWLTITGANAPSALLTRVLLAWQQPLRTAALRILPPQLCAALVDGVYLTVARVVAVMLPPMAIFFPLFTLLEDAGYLPRVAFVLDRAFARAGAHGRQSLTMCMGLGCNACGVTGCRIISSPRERLIAILTNSLMPCNGRFPLLITLLTLFFAGTGGTLLSAALLLGLLILAVCVTLFASRVLSRTLLQGQNSAFSLELPPYRMPRVGQVLVRSLLDRTLFVLGRAVTVAAPAGLLIWLLANSGGEVSLLARAAHALDPFAHFLGLDGMILLAFLLGFPANELVLPILLMGYSACGTLVDCEGAAALQLLAANGWTVQTALCTMLFSLLHFPCGTTVLTLHRETGSLRWTIVGILLPTLMGCAVCATVHAAFVLTML